MCGDRKLFVVMCSVLGMMLILLSLTGCGHIHKWQAATCTAPKTCTGCGETEGEKARHNVPEDGICTNCKQKQDNVLTLEPKARPIAPVVYDGVFLRIYLYSDFGTMFPGTYTIYAEDESAVASGDWGVIDWAETGPNSGRSPEFADAEYIPLQPGNYRVKFTYYTNFMYDDEVTKAFAPVGDPKLVNYTFIVR